MSEKNKKNQNNDKNCNKYEALFIFKNEKELFEHIETCPTCKYVHEKMKKISELIQEVRPYYIKRRASSKNFLKIACTLFIGIFTGLMIGYFVQYTTTVNYYSAESSSTIQTTNEYGIPIDNYGLITVN